MLSKYNIRHFLSAYVNFPNLYLSISLKLCLMSNVRTTRNLENPAKSNIEENSIFAQAFDESIIRTSVNKIPWTVQMLYGMLKMELSLRIQFSRPKSTRTHQRLNNSEIRSNGQFPVRYACSVGVIDCRNTITKAAFLK